MQAPRADRFRWKRAAARAMAIAFALAASRSAHAFTYTSGDLIGIFVDGNTELIVNLGPFSSLSSGANFSFSTPAGFGGDGSTGGKFVLYATEPPFSGSLNRNVTFSAASGVTASSYDTNVTQYVSRLGLAQSALDDGGANDKFLEVLNNFPAPPTGGVITNGTNQLAIPTSNPSSYTSTIGVSGSSDRIDNQLPFETDTQITGTNDFLVWRGNRNSSTTAQTVVLGQFRVEGNIGGGITRITYLPEPGPGLALALGIGALAALSRTRRSLAR